MILEIYEILSELAEKIGNGCRVGVYIRHESGGIPPHLAFQIDWPNGWHFRHEFSVTQLSAVPDDILKIVAYQAKKHFQNQITR